MHSNFFFFPSFAVSISVFQCMHAMHLLVNDSATDISGQANEVHQQTKFTETLYLRLLSGSKSVLFN